MNNLRVSLVTNFVGASLDGHPILALSVLLMAPDKGAPRFDLPSCLRIETFCLTPITTRQVKVMKKRILSFGLLTAWITITIACMQTPTTNQTANTNTPTKIGRASCRERVYV